MLSEQGRAPLVTLPRIQLLSSGRWWCPWQGAPVLTPAPEPLACLSLLAIAKKRNSILLLTWRAVISLSNIRSWIANSPCGPGECPRPRRAPKEHPLVLFKTSVMMATEFSYKWEPAFLWMWQNYQGLFLQFPVSGLNCVSKTSGQATITNLAWNRLQGFVLNNLWPQQ